MGKDASSIIILVAPAFLMNTCVCLKQEDMERAWPSSQQTKYLEYPGYDPVRQGTGGNFIDAARKQHVKFWTVE